MSDKPVTYYDMWSMGLDRIIAAHTAAAIIESPEERAIIADEALQAAKFSTMELRGMLAILIDRTANETD